MITSSLPLGTVTLFFSGLEPFVLPVILWVRNLRRPPGQFVQLASRGVGGGTEVEVIHFRGGIFAHMSVSAFLGLRPQGCSLWLGLLGYCSFNRGWTFSYSANVGYQLGFIGGLFQRCSCRIPPTGSVSSVERFVASAGAGRRADFLLIVATSSSGSPSPSF